MAHKNPLGKLKDLTVDTLKSPKEAAGKAVGQAKEAASVGKLIAGQATKSATSLTAGAVSKLVQGRKLTIPPVRPAEPTAPAAERGPLPTPVNVTEELGLDKAPVDTRPAAGGAGTAIDAGADPDHVEVTPADIAKSVAKKAPPRKPAATKPAAKKAPVKKAPAQKSAPGAKLPPRKKAPQSESATSTGGTDKG